MSEFDEKFKYLCGLLGMEDPLRVSTTELVDASIDRLAKLEAVREAAEELGLGIAEDRCAVYFHPPPRLEATFWRGARDAYVDAAVTKDAILKFQDALVVARSPSQTEGK